MSTRTHTHTLLQFQARVFLNIGVMSQLLHDHLPPISDISSVIALFPAFPSAPVISGGDHLTLGEESTLSCRVSDVYPAELITLTWLRGATVLQSTMGEPGSSSVQSRYQLQPEKRDSGAQITCRATLDLQDLLSEERIKETSITLNVLCEFWTW